MNSVSSTSSNLPTVLLNKELTKESTFKQRMVSKLKDAIAYFWATFKTLITVGDIKFKVSPHKVNSINLMGNNKYINFYADDKIHIFVGNHLDRNNIGSTHKAKIPADDGNVLTKDTVHQEITNAIDEANGKPITFWLNTNNYKEDINISENSQELSLDDALKEIISCLNTKSSETTSNTSTFNVFLETNNYGLVKDKLFDIYQKVNFSTNQENSGDAALETDHSVQMEVVQNDQPPINSSSPDKKDDDHEETNTSQELSREDTLDKSLKEDSASIVLDQINKNEEQNPVNKDNITQIKKDKKPVADAVTTEDQYLSSVEEYIVSNEDNLETLEDTPVTDAVNTKHQNASAVVADAVTTEDQYLSSVGEYIVSNEDNLETLEDTPVTDAVTTKYQNASAVEESIVSSEKILKTPEQNPVNKYNITQIKKDKKILREFIKDIFEKANRLTMVDSDDNINLLTNKVFGQLSQIKDIKSLKNYITRMPEINLVKLEFLQNSDVSKFKANAVKSLISKGYQHEESLAIIEKLFKDAHGSLDYVKDKLKKYPSKKIQYEKIAANLDISQQEVSKKIEELAISILKRDGMSDTSNKKTTLIATTMAQHLLEKRQDDISSIPSIDKFIMGYTTQQEYQETYNHCEKILQDAAKYSAETIKRILDHILTSYEKNDIENITKQFTEDTPKVTSTIAALNLGFSNNNELNKFIKEHFLKAVKNSLIKNNPNDSAFFAKRAKQILLSAKDKDSFAKDLLDLIPIKSDNYGHVRTIWATNTEYTESLQYAKEALEKKGYHKSDISNIIQNIMKESTNKERFHKQCRYYVNRDIYNFGYTNQIEADEIIRNMVTKLSETQLSKYFPKIIDIIKSSQKDGTCNKAKFTSLLEQMTTEDNVRKLISKYQKDPNSLPTHLEGLIIL